MLLVELHQLLLLALLVLLVLSLDPLHLRREPLHLLHRVKLLDGEGQQDCPDQNRQEDDRPAPRPADDAVDRLEDRLEDVYERLEDRCGYKQVGHALRGAVFASAGAFVAGGVFVMGMRSLTVLPGLKFSVALAFV